MRELKQCEASGIKAGGVRGGALFHSERFCLETIGVFAKVHPAKVESGRADFEFEVSSSKLELKEDLLGRRREATKRIRFGQEQETVGRG